MTNVDMAFTTLAVMGFIALVAAILYNRKLRKLHKK